MDPHHSCSLGLGPLLPKISFYDSPKFKSRPVGHSDGHSVLKQLLAGPIDALRD